MSIPEAVRLVLHSGAIGTSGDLCILDMGEQVRIMDLAENMIRMSGKTPGEDIEIQFTGIGLGEKLHEELYTKAEARSLRKIEKILVCRPDPGDGEFTAILQKLQEAALVCSRVEIVKLLQQLVPTYTPSTVEEQASARGVTTARE